MVKNIIKNVLLFLAIFLLINALFRSCTGEKNEKDILMQNDIGIATTKSEFARGKIVTVELRNNTKEKIEIESECPEEPLNVFMYKDGGFVQIHAKPDIDCTQYKKLSIEPEKKIRVLYSGWNHALFGELGRYKVSFKHGDKTFESNEFTIEEENVLRLLWSRMLYQPIYNVLIFSSKNLFHSLGLGIIILTMIIRLILLVPSQRALKQQRKMQLVQPKLEEIKKKHAGDQQKIAQETMALWKEHKVNPFGSCMPLLIQFPILIALFYVIRDGLNPDNTYLLYDILKETSLKDIGTNFLSILELTKVNIFWLPLVIGGLQFVQMKLTIAKKKAKNGEKEQKSEMAMANNMMLYFMPIMIAVFAASLPAGVGLYWGTSTLFGIGQQLIVNKEADNEGQTKVKIRDVKETNN